MVHVAAGQSGACWFGIAWEHESYVATATGATREQALKNVLSCMPESAEARFPELPCPFFDEALRMLGELERGDESRKRYNLSTGYRSEATQAILIAAAAIPIGFVATYGDIARLAGSEARAVGRVMAGNPLYPIIACHRVVGADMSLVGYGGKTGEQALNAKLGRLAAEARGEPHARNISLPGGALTVYPVERVIERARHVRALRARRAALVADREAADRLQYRLF